MSSVVDADALLRLLNNQWNAIMVKYPEDADLAEHPVDFALLSSIHNLIMWVEGHMREDTNNV